MRITIPDDLDIYLGYTLRMIQGKDYLKLAIIVETDFFWERDCSVRGVLAPSTFGEHKTKYTY